MPIRIDHAYGRRTALIDLMPDAMLTAIVSPATKQPLGRIDFGSVISLLSS